MKSNKTFVKSMIVTSVIGFTALLITLFIGIKYFVKEKVGLSPEIPSVTQDVDNTFYITSIGVVREIDEESITYLDIDKKEIITYKIKPTTKIQDVYENIMPYEQIKPGNIVDIVYQPEKGNLVCVRLSKEAFTKSDLKHLEIDRSNRTIKIGNKLYHYTGHTNIMDSEDIPINIYQINDYDILELKGINSDIYSIQVIAKEGYLQVGKLPVYEGLLEIDRNRQIPLTQNMQTLAMAPGEHKVTLHLKGYEPIVTTLTIEAGKTLEYNPQDFTRLQSALIVQVTNENVDYQVKVGDKLYNKEEVIQVPTGQYTIEIVAENFKPYKQEINLEETNLFIKVTLVPLEADEQSPDNLENDGNLQGSTSNSGTGNTLDYKINISSEPTGAIIYVDGEHKGTTPFKSTLSVGEHSIVLKKEAYRDYETNILIDHSDDQNSYLYTLIPN